MDAKDKFVELGVRHDSGEELGIACNTAANWERALTEKIAAQKAIRIEELQEKYLISEKS